MKKIYTITMLFFLLYSCNYSILKYCKIQNKSKIVKGENEYLFKNDTLKLSFTRIKVDKISDTLNYDFIKNNKNLSIVIVYHKNKWLNFNNYEKDSIIGMSLLYNNKSTNKFKHELYLLKRNTLELQREYSGKLDYWDFNFIFSLIGLNFENSIHGFTLIAQNEKSKRKNKYEIIYYSKLYRYVIQKAKKQNDNLVFIKTLKTANFEYEISSN